MNLSASAFRNSADLVIKRTRTFVACGCVVWLASTSGVGRAAEADGGTVAPLLSPAAEAPQPPQPPPPAAPPAVPMPPRPVAQALDDKDRTGLPPPIAQEPDGRALGRSLMLTGSFMFAGSYLLPPVVLGALGADRRYFLPVAGPLWIAGDQFTTKCDSNRGPCGFGDAFAGFMVVNGIVQATGLLLLIGGGMVYGSAKKPAAAAALPPPLPTR